MCPNSTDRRTFLASFSVRMGTKRVRFELADATLFGGAAGLFRVRIDRRWHDAPDDFGGEPLFLNRTALADLLANAALGELPAPPPPPELAHRQRVSVRIGFTPDGEPRTEGTWTCSPPILAHDGRWHIAVLLFGRGVVFVPCEEVIPHPAKKAGR